MPKKSLIYGYGITGKSFERYLLNQSIDFDICHENKKIPNFKPYSKVFVGNRSEYAARASFSRLLVPGTMALVTDLVGFGTLILLPIGMIQELGITASIGVAFKIITNLVINLIVNRYN